MGLFLGWIIFSIVIGAVGSNRKIGFAGAFFLSLILSPLIGLIITLTSKSTEDEAYRQAVLETQQKQAKELESLNAPKPSAAVSVADEIEKLKKLRDEGTITQDEYNSLRDRLIN